MSDLEIKKEHIDRYHWAHSGWINFLEAAEQDLDYYLNDQLGRAERSYLKKEGRTGFAFNKIRRFVELLSGFEIKDRHVLKIGPVGIEDDLAANQHTGVIMQQMNLYDGYDVLSDAFKLGSLVTGANLVEMYTDRRTDDVNFARLGYNEFLIDPTFSKRDLSDADFILRGKWLTDDQVKRLLPGKEREIDAIMPNNGGSRWGRLPNRHRRHGQDMRLYEEEWIRDIEKTKMVIIRDPRGRPVKVIPEKQFISDAKLFGRTERWARFVINNSRTISTFIDSKEKVKLRIYLDDELIFDGPNPTGLDTYNYVFVGGGFVPEIDQDEKKIMGLVRTAKDPQNAMNKRLNQILDIVETQLNSLRIMKEGALKNAKDAWGSGNGKVIIVDKHHQGTLDEAFRQVNGADIPPNLFNLFTVLDRTETEVVGLNTEIFGTEQKEIAGVLAKLRTGNALTGQQGLMNGYRQSKRQLGRLLVKYNQKNKKPQDIQRYTNEQVAEGFYDPDILRYDCNPVEGALTDSQRQALYGILLELKQYPDISPLITLDMLINTGQIPLGHKVKAELQKRQQQQAQKAQEAQKLQMAQLQLANAIAMGEVAKAQEDITDAQVNRSEVALNRAKTAMEIVKTAAEAQKVLSEPGLKLLDEAIKLEKINTDNQRTA